MYSSWNGHVECVKLLSEEENTRGVTKAGKKRSSLFLVTNKGYNALHLAAISLADSSNIAEIVLILLQAGINFTTLDKSGKTAYQLAVEANNTAFIEAYDSIIATIPINPLWNDPDEDGDLARVQLMSKERELQLKCEEMKKLVNKKPFKNLAILQDFQTECKINLDRRSLFNNYKTDSNHG